MGEEFVDNYRNVQNTNGRLVYYFENTCKAKRTAKVKKSLN